MHCFILKAFPLNYFGLDLFQSQLFISRPWELVYDVKIVRATRHNAIDLPVNRVDSDHAAIWGNVRACVRTTSELCREDMTMF